MTLNEEIEKLIKSMFLDCSVEEFGENVVGKYRIEYIPGLSEEFMWEFRDKLGWALLSNWQQMSESFIEKAKDYVNWFYVSKNQKLSEEFIMKNLSKLDIGAIFYHQNISINLMVSLKEYFIENARVEGKINNMCNSGSYKQIINSKLDKLKKGE